MTDTTLRNAISLMLFGIGGNEKNILAAMKMYHILVDGADITSARNYVNALIDGQNPKRLRAVVAANSLYAQDGVPHVVVSSGEYTYEVKRLSDTTLIEKIVHRAYKGTFTDFMKYVTLMHAQTINLRYGLVCSNTLITFNRQLSDQVRGTSIDPYHDDAIVPQFLQFLSSNLPQ